MPWGHRLANDMVLYGLGGSGANVINAFLLYVFTRFLSPADVGLMHLLTSIASIAKVIGGLGHEAGGREDTERQSTLLSTRQADCRND